MTYRVIVVDDEATARDELCEALRDDGFIVDGVGDGQSAIDLMSKTTYDVCISDIRMPGMDGITLLKKIAEFSPETTVMMVTAYGDMQTAIEALRSGASDYVLKPVIFEDIIAKVRRLVEFQKLAREVRHFRRITGGGSGSGEASAGQGMIGSSEGLSGIQKLIAKVAPTNSNVLIRGESGTGKELVARAIHKQSDRAKEPFIAINCAAIPENLLESELFGHTKGSFTGAVADKDGLLRIAGEGTVFLDEIGDMPQSLQAKLLRAIEQREVQPVGATRTVSIGARILSATHRDLLKAIEEERFREDFYYRLAVVEVAVPPLRERRSDIPELVKHFIEKHRGSLKRDVVGASREALALLGGYDWPGNIRELENTIERALILGESEYVEVDDLPPRVRAASPAAHLPEDDEKLSDALHRFEQNHIERVLARCDGDKRAAAKALGLSLSTFYRKFES